MEYIRLSNELDCIKADEMLTSLIKYESNFDSVINHSAFVEGFHKEVLNKSHVFAYYVKENDECVGYIFAYLKNPYNDVIRTNVVMLESLFIREDYRGKGIGKNLIKMLEEWANDSFKNYVIEIVCLSNNEKALKFYESLGYCEVKTILRK